MNIKNIFRILIVLAISTHGCIREDVLLPPVLEQLTNASLISNEKISINGNYLDPSSARLFINDTIRDVAGITLTEITFIVPDVEMPTESSLHVTTNMGRSNILRITILPRVPAIKKLIPAQAGVGKTIKIIGRHFGSITSTSVEFKSADQTDFRLATITKAVKDTLEVVVPKGLSRDATDIRVKSESGISPLFSFTVLAPPGITRVDPAKGGIGALIKIEGTDFNFIEQIRFGSLMAEILTQTSEVVEVRIPPDATTDSLYVDTRGGTGRHGELFIIVPKPEITGLNKNTGSIGTEVSITGLNFQDVFEVKFGNTPASILDKTNTVINTRIPPGAESGKISVTTPGGTGQSAEIFMVKDAPLISSYAPSSGSSGTKVVLTGLNLMAVTEVRIGLLPLIINSGSKTDNKLEVEVPTGAVTGKISITGPGGTFETANSFVVTGTPQITAVSPASGAPGTIVTITGLNFPVTPLVKFSNAQASVSAATATQIVCQVPTDATTGKINVNGTISPADFTVIVKPVITSIVPMKGGPDKEVTINGVHLTGATVKFFNNTTAAKVSMGTNSQIIVKVPAGASTGKISVTTSGGTAASLGDFEVVSFPTITSFSPLSGVAGTTVTINGTNLQHNPVVQFFNQSTATVKSISAMQLLVEVPVGAGTGKLTVRTDAVSTPVASAGNFTVIGKPAITSISPSAGTIYEKVTIQGHNFDNLVSVNFDGLAANTIISSSNTQIVVRVPENVSASANRSINVNVKTNADISGNATFSLLGTPTITKISPDNNPSNWAFLIEGTNLSSVKKLALDNKVPDIGIRGIDKQAYNYITTKVPKDAASGDDQKLLLYFTSDDFQPIERSYKVLNAPPPGIFPPPTMILPPPIPSSYLQTDLSNYWIDENFTFSGQDSVLSCYQLRASFSGQPSGNFCIIGKFHAVKTDGVWDVDPDTFSYGSGSWNNGNVSLSFLPQNYTGQVLDQAASKLVLTDEDGRQLILVMDKSNACFKAYQVIGVCD